MVFAAELRPSSRSLIIQEAMEVKGSPPGGERHGGSLKQDVDHVSSSVQAAKEPDLEGRELSTCAWAMLGRLLASIDDDRAEWAREAVSM